LDLREFGNISCCVGRSGVMFVLDNNPLEVLFWVGGPFTVALQSHSHWRCQFAAFQREWLVVQTKKYPLAISWDVGGDNME